MQATNAPTQLVEQRAWCWREQNKLSEAFATAWCFLSDTMLLERPVVSTVVSAAVCIALASGLTDIDVTYSVTSTLCSRGTDRRRNADEVAQLFPSSPRFSQILFTTPEPNSSSHEEDTNVLKEEIFDEIWSIAEKASELRTAGETLRRNVISNLRSAWFPQAQKASMHLAHALMHKGRAETERHTHELRGLIAYQVALIEAGLKNESYDSLCYRHSTNGRCASYGVLSFWDGDEALYRSGVADNQSLRIGLSSETFRDGTPVPRDLVFGDYSLVKDEASDENILAYARGVMVTYALNENTGSTSTVLEWEQAFLRLASETTLTSSRMTWQAAMSNTNERKAGTQGWGFVATTLSLMAMATASSFLLGDMPLGGIPAIHTRIALGAVGVGFLVLSTAAAAGTLAMGGVPVSGVHSPFIAVVCVAIGLENLFGLCSELDDALCDAPARHRVRRAALRWAPGSVLVVTLSSMTILVGAGSYSSAATRSFCAFAGASVLLGWVTQVFGFVPCLLIDEKRKDVARFDLGCCWKETTQPERIISGPPRVRSRRDSFVLEQLSDTDHPAAIADETWNDTGDEARCPPCSPAAALVGKTVPTQPSSSCRYGTSHETGELSLPFPRSPPRVRNGGSERGAGGNNGQDCHQTKRPDVHQPRSRHEANNDIITAVTKREASAGGLRVSALIQEKPWKNMTPACFEAVEAPRNPRGWGRGQGETGGSEPSCWGGVVQGYCNWLLDRNSARRAVLAGFGVLVATAVSIISVEGSPGYDINVFFRRSSYLRDFVTTARRHGMLLGESSLPVAAYIRGVDLSEVATQQAILDLEIALVSSSQSTIASTTSIDQDAVVSGNATSSWLRGFINWLPSSSYASSSEEYTSANEQGLWVGSADLFHEAVNDFLAEPEYQRFEDDFSFHEGKPVACRIWARHLNFKGPNAVATMKAAGDAVAAIGIEPVPFVFATEYIFAEQYAATTREIAFSMIATAVSTTVIGYLFLGRVALACILALTTFVAQVQALTIVVLLYPGGSGLNGHIITPSLFLTTGLCAGSVGAMLQSFATQDCERSFYVNLRISIAETAGPVSSASVVVAIGVLPLLLFSAASASTTYFFGSVAICALLAALLSLLHALLLAPILLLACEECMVPTPTPPFSPAATIEAETLPWLPRSRPGKNAEMSGNGYVLAVGRTGAVAVLGENKTVGSNRDGGGRGESGRTNGYRVQKAHFAGGSTTALDNSRNNASLASSRSPNGRGTTGGNRAGHKQ